MLFVIGGLSTLGVSVLPRKTSGLEQYDCNPFTNFGYAGLSMGPQLNQYGLIDMKDLEESQMRILRPVETKGGCANGDDYAFLVRRGRTLDKVVVEFQGGGACWSYETCMRYDNRDYRNVDWINDFVDPFAGIQMLDCAKWNSLIHSAHFGGIVDQEQAKCEALIALFAVLEYQS